MAGLNIAREIGNSALNENSPICLPAIALPFSGTSKWLSLQELELDAAIAIRSV